MTEPVQITRDLPSSLQFQVARLFCQSFSLKLRRLAFQTEDMAKLLRICRRSLHYENAFYALASDEVLGLAGMQEGQSRFAAYDRESIVQEFGWLGGHYRWVPLAIEAWIRLPKDALRVDALAVAPHVRRQGIATQLLEAVADYGRTRGYRWLRLEVVDTNLGARRLYEQNGFVPYRRIYWGPFTRPAGFDMEIRMRKALQVEASTGPRSKG